MAKLVNLNQKPAATPTLKIGKNLPMCKKLFSKSSVCTLVMQFATDNSRLPFNFVLFIQYFDITTLIKSLTRLLI